MPGIATQGPFGVFANVLVISTPILQVNTNRSGLIFFNSSPMITVFLCPGNLTATINQGVTLLPQSDYRLMPIGDSSPGYGGAWNAIASSPVTILIMEFFNG